MASDDRWGDDERRDRWDDERGRGGPRGGDPAAGRAKVKGAGTVLLVFGLFSLLLAVVGLGLYQVSPDSIARPYYDMLKDMTKGVPQQPGQPDPLGTYDEFKQKLVVQGSIGSAVGAICSLVIAVAGSKMRNATSRGLAMTGAILSMIPCTNTCCLIGLPIGIWVLVVLANPDVKAAFAEAAVGGPGRDQDEYGR